MTSTLRKFLDRIEARNLARLSEPEREEVQAFDAMVRKRAWQFWGLFLGVWALGTAGLWAFNARISILEAALLSLVFILATAFGVASVWFGHRRYKGPLYRAALITIILPILGAIFGALIGFAIRGEASLLDVSAVLAFILKSGPKVLIAGLVVGLIYSVFMVSVIRYRRQQLQQRNEELEIQAREDRLVRSLTDAKLKLMQAQVEPHFLFNTLSTVKQLAEPKAPEAAQLTGNLITFLRAGLSGLRGDQATLGAEVDMAAAYLAIMQTRMGERLRFSVEVPAGLRDVRVPPAMLISLVENAIKHGLEPSPRGGTVRITAERQGDDLIITVADTGLGMSDIPGGGVGLANIRERMSALFGTHAELTLTENAPHGFIARMRLPPLPT